MTLHDPEILDVAIAWDRYRLRLADRPDTDPVVEVYRSTTLADPLHRCTLDGDAVVIDPPVADQPYRHPAAEAGLATVAGAMLAAAAAATVERNREQYARAKYDTPRAMLAAAAAATVERNREQYARAKYDTPRAMLAGTAWRARWDGPDGRPRFGFGPSPGCALRSLAATAGAEVLRRG